LAYSRPFPSPIGHLCDRRVKHVCFMNVSTQMDMMNILTYTHARGTRDGEARRTEAAARHEGRSKRRR